MKLHYVKEYKSITSLNTKPETLPRFSVITGLNGSGKTHLLEAIENKCILAKDENSSVLNPSYFSYLTLVPQDISSSAESLESEKKVFFEAWSKLKSEFNEHTISQIKLILKNEYSDIAMVEDVVYKAINGSKEDFLETVLHSDRNQELSKKEVESTTNKVYAEIQAKIIEFSNICVKRIDVKFASIRASVAPRPNKKQPDSAIDLQINNLLSTFEQRGVKPSSILKNIADNSEKPLFTIDRDTFFRCYPKEIHANPLQRSFSLWFTRYLAELRLNKIREIADELSEGSTSFLSDSHFIEKHGIRPWEFTQKVLEDARIGLKVNKPSFEDNSDNFRATFQDSGTGNTVHLNELSSGEKVILSLILAFSQVPHEDIAKDGCDLLLLDEIEASLHPSLTQYLFSVLNSILENRDNMHIILVTHSPSTIALSDETSLYTLRASNSDKTLEKCSKDEAISMLTEGISTLSVKHENQRQVIVESKYDAESYSQLYKIITDYQNKMQKSKPSEISLSFIPSGGSQKGGSDMVIEHVDSFTRAGVSSIYGIIDWDKKNEDEGRVYICGQDSRYSLENFLLDPLLVGALLILQKKTDLSSIGFENQIPAHEIKDVSNSVRQKLSDCILATIKPSKHMDDKKKKSCDYEGGFSLELPEWFLYSNGHDMEKQYRNFYPKLQQYGDGENDLKAAVIQHILNDYPQLLPVEFAKLFEKLRK